MKIKITYIDFVVQWLSCVQFFATAWTVCIKGHSNFPGGSEDKESACNAGRRRFNPWVRKIPWWRKWQPTPVFLLGESSGQRSLVGYTVCGIPRVRHNLATKPPFYFFFTLINSFITKALDTELHTFLERTVILTLPVQLGIWKIGIVVNHHFKWSKFKANISRISMHHLRLFQ